MSTASEVVAQMKSAMLAARVKPPLSKEIALELHLAGLTKDWAEFSEANSKAPVVVAIQKTISDKDEERATAATPAPIPEPAPVDPVLPTEEVK